MIYRQASQSTNEANGSIEIENSIEVSTEDSEQHATIPTVEPIKRQIKHKRSIHKNHMCQHCGRGFPSVSLLTTHNRCHTGERWTKLMSIELNRINNSIYTFLQSHLFEKRPFKCTTCSKSFKTQGALDLHERRHAGLKSYTCTVRLAGCLFYLNKNI